MASLHAPPPPPVAADPATGRLWRCQRYLTSGSVDSSSSKASVTLQAQTVTSGGLGEYLSVGGGSGGCQLSNIPEAALSRRATNLCCMPPAVEQLSWRRLGSCETLIKIFTVRNKMKEQRQYFTREIETKKNQTNSEVTSIKEMNTWKNWKLSRLYGRES